MELHPDCEQLAFLLGTWQGRGAGEYPTIESFEYHEEVVFGHVGKPFLSYGQKTRDASTGQPLHAESGYLRAVGPGQVEFVIVQPSGIVEIHTGTVDSSRHLQLTLRSVETTPTAKSVTGVERRIRVESRDDESTLVYDVAMAAVDEPMTHHLHAELNLQRQDPATQP